MPGTCNSYSVGSVSTATNNNNNVNNVIGTTLNNAVSTGNNVAFPTNNNIDAGLTGVGDTSSSAQLNFATSGTGAGGGNPFLTSSVQAFPSEPFQQAESQVSCVGNGYFLKSGLVRNWTK